MKKGSPNNGKDITPRPDQEFMVSYEAIPLMLDLVGSLLGVFVGYLLANWNERRRIGKQEKEEALKGLSIIEKEIKANHERLEDPAKIQTLQIKGRQTSVNLTDLLIDSYQGMLYVGMLRNLPAPTHVILTAYYSFARRINTEIDHLVRLTSDIELLDNPRYADLMS